MANSSYSFLLTLCLVLGATLIMAASPAAASGGQNMMWFPRNNDGGGCKGTVAECMGMGEEFEMDSEINRRILATTQYISYGALQRNTVPCDQRGASYYNCQPGAQANPYSRGCSALARCRG